jgi:hypothetical protein
LILRQHLSGLDRFLILRQHLSGLDRFLILRQHLSGLDRFFRSKPETKRNGFQKTYCNRKMTVLFEVGNFRTVSAGL